MSACYRAADGIQSLARNSESPDDPSGTLYQSRCEQKRVRSERTQQAQSADSFCSSDHLPHCFTAAKRQSVKFNCAAPQSHPAAPVLRHGSNLRDPHSLCARPLLPDKLVAHDWQNPPQSTGFLIESE